MVNKCETRLIPDLPTDSDFFGSHRRVAEGISNTIETEEGSKTIGLKGDYGSGKSTVVKILKKIFAEKKEGSTSERALFVFNAWSHQGDPLRRSFLEELVEFLSENHQNWIKKKNWEKALDTIRKRFEITETKNSPTLTLSGTILAICTLFIPVGILILSNLDSDSSWFMWFIGVIFSFFPIFGALATWIYWRPSLKIFTWKFWIENRPPYEEDSIIGFFNQKTTETHKSTTIRTPDPTSIEFRDIFNRILKDAIEKTDRKLVIVLDNLDRVDSKEAITIWTTMRTFFEIDHRISHPWVKGFWLIVPFDPNGLQPLLGPPSNIEREDKEGQPFIGKGFQSIFKVSPPVLSDWKKYLMEQLEYAFPIHKQKDDFHIIYQVYRRVGIPLNRFLTPRDIIIFINKLGSIHRQWGDDIPLPIQSLYVIFEKKSE